MKNLIIVILLAMGIAACNTTKQPNATRANTDGMAMETEVSKTTVVGPGNMAVTGTPYNRIGETVFVKESSGGDPRVEVTILPFQRYVHFRNVDFTEALELSVVKSGFFTKTSSRWTEKWSIEPTIIAVEKPKFGKLMRAYTKINYKVFRDKTKVLDITIEKEGFSVETDTDRPVQRHRIAMERSAKANIAAFLEALAAVK